jgi:hypothetical protein
MKKRNNVVDLSFCIIFVIIFKSMSNEQYISIPKYLVYFSVDQNSNPVGAISNYDVQYYVQVPVNVLKCVSEDVKPLRFKSTEYCNTYCVQ